MRGVSILVLVLLTTLVSAERDRGAKPEPAISAMANLFRSHDIVMFGETHGNKQGI